MANLTVRQLSEETKSRLVDRARRHNQSLEAEVRQILDRAAQQPMPADDVEGFPHWFIEGSRPGFDLDELLADQRRPHAPIALGEGDG